AATGGSVAVISSVLPGLVDPTTPPVVPQGIGLPAAGGAAAITVGGTTVKGDFTLRIQEGFQDMFRSASQFNGGGSGVFPPSISSSTQLNILGTNIPSGLSISNCFAVLTDTAGHMSAGSPVVSSSSVSAFSPVVTVAFPEQLSLNSIDVLWFSCHVDA